MLEELGGLVIGKRGPKLTLTRNITDPRALALVLEQAEAKLAKEAHPDPYRRESHPLSLSPRKLVLTTMQRPCSLMAQNGMSPLLSS